MPPSDPVPHARTGSLPKESESQRLPDTLSERHPIPASNRKFTGTALVADDQPLVRRVLVRLVQSLGFETVEAEDGLQALEAFQREPQRFRLAVVDQTMPKLDGVQVFLKLRQLHPEVPVVLVSGCSELEVLNQFADGEGPVLLTKPFSRDDLADKLDDLLPRG